MARKVVKENLFFLMDAIMKVTILIIAYMVLELIHGLMVGPTQDSGRTTKCTEKAFLHGLMVANIKESMKMIRSTIMASTSGQMAATIKDIGSSESSMAMVLACFKTVRQ